MNAIILKGVHVGNNVIIGAGSVVNKDIPDDCVVVGNPAKIVYSIEEYRDKRRDKQYSEASELVKTYRLAYKKNPNDAELAEFFWLYTGVTNEYASLADVYKEKMKLLGNEKLSMQKLRENHNSFSSKEQFLDSIR